MAVRNSVIRVEPDLVEAFNGAPKREQDRVKSVMRGLLKLVPSPVKAASRLSREESRLFLKINRALPEKKQQRYDQLKEKQREEVLAKHEHQELLGLIGELEQLWSERLQAVIDLANLRKITPKEMMRQLGVDPEKYG
jgi:hypothetical protein